MLPCLHCGILLVKRQQIKFCSNRCQSDFRYKKYIESWGNGKVSGNRGIVAKNISGHLKRFLIEKFQNQCFICGWNKKHPITDVISLEIDHIDGNAENNLENNLRLLCPNCHALTPFYKNMNRGRGRRWRMDKYIKNGLK